MPLNQKYKYSPFEPLTKEEMEDEKSCEQDGCSELAECVDNDNDKRYCRTHGEDAEEIWYNGDPDERDPNPRETKGDLDFHEGREMGWW